MTKHFYFLDVPVVLSPWINFITCPMLLISNCTRGQCHVSDHHLANGKHDDLDLDKHVDVFLVDAQFRPCEVNKMYIAQNHAETFPTSLPQHQDSKSQKMTYLQNKCLECNLKYLISKEFTTKIYCFYMFDMFNSLWLRYAIWWLRSGSILAQVMAWCLRPGTPVLEVIFNKYLSFEFSTGNSFLLLGL